MPGSVASASAWAAAAVSATWSRKARVTPRPSSRGTAAGAQSTVQGVQRGRAVDDGSRAAAVVLPHQRGEPRCVQGGGHGDEREVAAQLADLGEHAEQQVGFQPAFMDLVEDHCTGAFQPGIREQAAQQDARSDELDQGPRARLAFAADRVPHAVPEPAAVQGGKTPGRRARGNAARLGHHRCAAPCRPPGRAPEVTRRRGGWRPAAEPAWSCLCRAGPAPPRSRPGRPHAAPRRAAPGSLRRPGRHRWPPGQRGQGCLQGPGKRKSPVHCARIRQPRRSRSYGRWKRLRMLPSVSRNQAAFPAVLVAMPFSVFSPGKS